MPSGRVNNKKKTVAEEKAATKDASQRNETVEKTEGEGSPQQQDSQSPRGSVIQPSPVPRTPNDESGGSDVSAVFNSIRKKIGLDLSGSTSSASGSRQGGGDREGAEGGSPYMPPAKRCRIVSTHY